MPKSVISQSDELHRLQLSLRSKNAWGGIGLGFLVVLLFLVYLLLAALGHGYYGLSAPFGSVSWLSGIRYLDMTSFLFDFSSASSLPRFFILLGVLALAAAVGIIYGKLHARRLDRIYQDKFLKLLTEEAKINGLVIDYKPKADLASSQDALRLFNIASPDPSFSFNFSTPLLSWEGKQLTYLRDGKKRPAFLISTELSKARTHAFIQLRTFGEPDIKQYEGLPIMKYGFGDMAGLQDFVCFTTLGQDIYLVIDKKTAESLASFYAFVRCDIIVMAIGDRLTIFLDGFQMKVTHGLADSLPPQILEQEAEALVALHQSITSLSAAFAGEIGFAPEEKGNGILDY
jgi:hypothetical protein